MAREQRKKKGRGAARRNEEIVDFAFEAEADVVVRLVAEAEDDRVIVRRDRFFVRCSAVYA